MDEAIKLDIGSSSELFILGRFSYVAEFKTSDHDESPREEDIEICVRLFKDVNKIRNLFNHRGICSESEDEEDEKDNFKVLFATQNQTESTQQREVRIVFQLETLDSNEIQQGKPYWVSEPPALEAGCHIPVTTIEFNTDLDDPF